MRPATIQAVPRLPLSLDRSEREEKRAGRTGGRGAGDAPEAEILPYGLARDPDSALKDSSDHSSEGFQSLMTLEPSRHGTPLSENAMLSRACQGGSARARRQTIVHAIRFQFQSDGKLGRRERATVPLGG
jgi:hypothetical protein